MAMVEDRNAPFVLVGPVHPLRGGIAQFSAQVHEGLARSHRVEVISFSRQYPDWAFPGRSQLDDSRTARQVPAARMIDSLAPWTWWRAAAHIARLQPSAVVFMYWMPFFAPAYGTMVRRLKGRTGARILFLCHNLHPHEPGPLDRALTRYGLRHVDGVLALSECVASDVRRAAPRTEVRCVPHPVPTTFGPRSGAADARRRYGLPPDDLVMLFFGHIRPYKDLSCLVRALPRVLARRSCRLLVAGEFYEPRAPYDRLIADLGIGDRVTILDRYVPDEEVPDVFAAADVCVLPYARATQSGVSKMAYGFGVPVVVTDVGGLAEEVIEGDTGYVVPPGDPDAIAAAIERFCAARTSHDFGAAIAVARARFAWDPLIAALADMAGVS